MLGTNLERSPAADLPASDVPELRRYRLRRSEDEITSYVGMIIFLGSWAMMFAALFFAYAVVRLRAPMWPPPDQPALPILIPGLNTVVIAGSSAAVAVAVWVGLWRAGLLPTGGPYASVFYALTAFHALHVVVGLVALGALAIRAQPPRGTTRSAVRLWGMFWHFVGVVWVALYVAVYLL